MSPSDSPPGSLARRQGFTLIELAIVLLVVGLVTAVIFVGRDLVRAAEIRGTVSQVERFNGAVNTFKSKYGCLPGDCAQAANQGFATGSSGDGNGVIGCRTSDMTACVGAGSFVISTQTAEYVNFWYHLSDAKLIAFDGAQFDGGDSVQAAGKVSPAVKVSARTLPAGWVIRAGARFRDAGTAVDAHALSMSIAVPPMPLERGGFSPADIMALDQKMDDGLPVAGSVRGWHYAQVLTDGTQLYGYFGSDIGLGSARCIRPDTDPYQYDIRNAGSDSSGLCSAMIKVAF